MTPRLRLLLAAVGVLLALRLVVVPWLDWVDERRQRLASLERQLAKASAVAARRENAADPETLAAARDKLDQWLPAVADLDARQRQWQKAILAAFSEAGVTIDSLNWRSELPGEVAGSGLPASRVALTVTGPPHAVAAALHALQVRHPAMAPVNMSLFVRHGRMNGKLLLDFRHRAAGSASTSTVSSLAPCPARGCRPGPGAQPPKGPARAT